jgi:hypothetical protein
MAHIPKGRPRPTCILRGKGIDLNARTGKTGEVFAVSAP